MMNGIKARTIAQAIHHIRQAVTDTIRESPEPVPESIIFLGLESRGIPHHIVKLIVDTLVADGQLQRKNHLLSVP